MSFYIYNEVKRYWDSSFKSVFPAKACRTDVRFMWLLDGEPAPNHATISRFQDERLYQFVEKLYEMGEVKFKNLFVDGTKIEAYTNKYIRW